MGRSLSARKQPTDLHDQASRTKICQALRHLFIYSFEEGNRQTEQHFSSGGASNADEYLLRDQDQNIETNEKAFAGART